MNSARIHGGDATWDLVHGLLKSKEVRLVWLPKYSPEFNPVELFWRFLKGLIRFLPTTNSYQHLKDIIIDITATIPMEMIFNWFCEAMTTWQKSQ
jgi:transposase